ncbi:MAG: T9SS type A sorting domain-containing protein [Chitinophagaceae bacterium]|nr:T9SS type A sorting domain-containing protein [Chitinophagaceae bacterium]MBP6476411.1 T9SS type A sorting domain-containing protein [Chitinophagaceae bacterium]MBP7108326.1 T9SS type A sorting domain-containing protein [Chitinophagaceae bacterium]MBP7313894.1 T9SS type A sorting domain-containing protein [Chitinophagaceae bacterium]HQX95269.1 T9SS type A sorting domain-containing protein [Chitinophagaceae bacterium]
MNKIVSPLLLLLYFNTTNAQLTITSGTQFYLSGPVQLTLHNTDFINDGTFTRGTSKVLFTGNTSSSISGSGGPSVIFHELEINKTAGSAVVLQRFTLATQQVNFIAGFLDLNGFNFGLGNSGVLNGENENSRVVGLNGGKVTFTATLNAPVAANPGNLGAIISSPVNMGTVAIARGHQSQVNSSGLGSSVLRYYDILPVTTNTGLNATLRFQYFDAELNSINESSLVFWKSPNNINWTNEGFTSRNASSNYVEKTGINSFSRWTLSSPNNALPVQFILFNVKCENNNVVINWKTAQEQNSSHFNIEQSADGISWRVIGSVPAAGSSSNERSYSFIDNNPVQNSFYRVAEYDIDGKVQYTSILKASCAVNDELKVWPNPFTDMVFVNINTNSRSTAIIKVFDGKGALIKTQTTALLQGNNQVNVAMEKLPAGMYQLVIEWNNGQMKKAVQLIRQ